MIIDKDTNPERSLYYLGALTLEILLNIDEEVADFLYVYSELKNKSEISIRLFLFTLDWLFLLGKIENENGNIKKCF